MPGAPLTSTSDPRTAPPPSTRSSSDRPVPKRSSSPLVTSFRRFGCTPTPRAADVRLERLLRDGAAACGGVYSSSVFHCPQDGQRPCHRGVSLPQFEQRKTVLAAFIGFLQKFQHAAAQNCRKLLLIFRRAQQGLLRRVGQETALHEHGGAAHMLQISPAFLQAR